MDRISDRIKTASGEEICVLCVTLHYIAKGNIPMAGPTLIKIGGKKAKKLLKYFSDETVCSDRTDKRLSVLQKLAPSYGLLLAPLFHHEK